MSFSLPVRSVYQINTIYFTTNINMAKSNPENVKLRTIGNKQHIHISFTDEQLSSFEKLPISYPMSLRK